MDNVASLEMRIGEHSIGLGQAPLLIAEIGINHNGSLLRAKELVLKAKDCGARVVKFQKRDLPSIYTDAALNNLERFEQGFQYLIPILKKCELTEDEMEELKVFSEALGLTFLCTAFDLKSAQFLKKLNLSAYKLSSADLTNMPLIEELASYKKPLLLSTGMSVDTEIRYTVDFLKSKQVPFILLHCVSSYPVDPQKANLERIRVLALEHDCLVGYSGHDLGTSLSILASSFGACIIEKHFTLDRALEGPDHKVSLLPEELKRLAARLREEKANGVSLQLTARKEKKEILQGELLNKQVFRKGIVAAKEISAGEPFTAENLALKSPGGSLTGQDLADLIGKESPNSFGRDEPITLRAQESHWMPPAVNEWGQWGFVVRYHDFQTALESNPRVLEFHLTYQDALQEIPLAELEAHREQLQRCLLRVHCCEYLSDRLFDLCSGSRETRSKSLQILQRVLDITDELSAFFSPEPAAVIFNCGGMTLEYDTRGVDIDEAQFHKDLLSLRTHRAILLAQNMPPFPWYYGGQWKGHFFLEPEELIRFCKKTGHYICLDLSHAAMAAKYLNRDLASYIFELKPYVRHIHISDAKSIEGEGAQLGEGSINFQEFVELYHNYPYTWVPEIWQGHLEQNAGAKKALKAFSTFLENIKAPSMPHADR